MKTTCGTTVFDEVVEAIAIPAYVLVFAVVLLFSSLFLSEGYAIFTATPAVLKQYPWGTEWGWNYSNPEVYMRTCFTDAYIGFQSLAVSLLFMRGRRDGLRLLLALGLLLLAPVLGGMTAEEWGH